MYAVAIVGVNGMQRTPDTVVLTVGYSFIRFFGYEYNIMW